MRQKTKKHAGMTLTEILIALAFLSIIVVPILTMFVSGTRLTTASYKLTTAAVTAQMRMEELVGLTESELTGEFGRRSDYNGFAVEAQPTYRDLGFDYLIEVNVTVYDGDGSTLYILTNVLNVAPGGMAEEAAGG